MHRSKETVSWQPGRDYIQKRTPFRFNRLYHTHTRSHNTDQAASPHVHIHTHTEWLLTTHIKAHERELNTHTHTWPEAVFFFRLLTPRLYISVHLTQCHVSLWVTDISARLSTRLLPSLPFFLSPSVSLKDRQFGAIALTHHRTIFSSKIKQSQSEKLVSLDAHEVCFLPPVCPIVFRLCCISPKQKERQTHSTEPKACNYLLGYSFIDVHLLCFVYCVCVCAPACTYVRVFNWLNGGTPSVLTWYGWKRFLSCRDQEQLSWELNPWPMRWLIQSQSKWTHELLMVLTPETAAKWWKNAKRPLNIKWDYVGL